MGYTSWSEKSQYSPLPQQDDIDQPPISTERLQRETSSGLGAFQYIRLFLYSITCIAFIISFVWTGPAALQSYLDAPSSSSDSSINLIIVASALNDDFTTWTKDTQTKSVQVIAYHPPAPSFNGSEALVYLNHIYEFYDKLPSISIFSNGWDKSISPSALDLSDLQSLGFLPLCVQDPSVSGMNDGVISSSQSSSFRRNFPTHEIPDKLSAPCSRFAVSRDAVRAIPREQYLHHADLLREAYATPDAEETWDVMWQYLFLHGGKTTEVFPDN
ncbi:hypothetical protein DSL72_003362 [Monilinia vaccinii-corymbosi]|uniref:Uncharacterized protein n=1 Tax=Monilinia vaccinii-corymbosi TaxID=61207 RepID=A0A8A3P8Y0_9HELO|nr:hypothetical protein DSL72_003362 [Monilinia vaccinii-corymbosi]